MRTTSAEEIEVRPTYGRFSHVKMKAHQANERTLIVWVCAGLLIMAGSIPAAQFSREIDASPVVDVFVSLKSFQTSSMLGLAALISGVVVSILSCFRYVRARQNIEEGIYRGPDFFHLAFLGVILFASLFVGLYLMEKHGAHWIGQAASSSTQEIGDLQERPGPVTDTGPKAASNRTC